MEDDEVGVCECVGDGCKGEVRYVADPYIEEIDNEIVMKWLCDQHYCDYADDI